MPEQKEVPSEEEITPSARESVAEIPPDVRGWIERETEKDIAPIIEEDPATAEFYREIQRDSRECLYTFLNWVKEEFWPISVLYPGSGFDRLPKLVFGEEAVVHTSLEGYQPGGRKYFEVLGKGKRVVADNVAFPFPDSNFSAIVLLGLPYEAVGPYRDEIIRVLDEAGVIVLEKNILTAEDQPDIPEHFGQSPVLEKVEVPSYFEKTGGPSETQFFLFKKKPQL